MPILKDVLGDSTMLLPDIWTWFIEKGDQNTGWPIHRDLLNLQETKVGEPNMITLWIPLVDVDAYNSCIYLVPKHLDKNYPDNLDNFEFSAENARAIALPAGSLVAWSANILHWGSRSTPYAKSDRLSMAFYLQREGAPMNEPTINFEKKFPFSHRLRYIATQIVDYSRDNFAPYVIEWAKENRFDENKIQKEFY
jgi:ectoine hydroxylase-related dioxygenase (phytanoyl-CoA dioxygenase family)